MLLTDLSIADVILLFAPCDALAKGTACLSELRRLNVLLTHILTKRAEQATVVVVLTKADLALSEKKDLLSPLHPICEAIGMSANVIGVVLPVICGPEVVNVRHTCHFAISAGLRQEQIRLIQTAATGSDEKLLLMIEKRVGLLHALESSVSELSVF